jgi:hypothetical protein
VHLGIGRRHASIPVVYPSSAPPFSITTTKPAAAKLTGYFDVEGVHLATIGCPSHSTPPATVRIVVQFR